jgi:ubiquinone/menaquinone biosynthesis C-methylase UbiE
MDKRDAVVREEFTRQAEAMSTAALFNDETILERIVEAAGLKAGSRALDVACGPGIVVEALARRGGDVVGCDITPAMLEKTRSRAAAAHLDNVACVPGRAEALPFENDYFDVVVSRSAVHHFSDPAAALGEMARVVRPGGRVVTVDVMSAEAAQDSALHNALETLRDPSHVRMLSRTELHRTLVAAGLRVDSCVTWVNHREFGEWMKIVSAPERIDPLKIVMTALARGGVTAGIGLHLENDRLLFDHTAGLTVASKP